MKFKIRHSIFFLMIILMIGCQKDLYNFTQKFRAPELSKEPPLVEYIIDKDNLDQIEAMSHLAKVADYAKIPFRVKELKKFNSNYRIEPTTRVLCVYDTQELNDAAITSFLSFIARGGTLFITRANMDPRLSFLIGLHPGATLEIDTNAHGYFFKKAILPGIEDLSVSNGEILHRGLKRENFSEETNILAAAKNDKEYPLIIEHKIGGGRVVLVNSIELVAKSSRGVLFASVLLGLEGIPYPVANVSTIFLDDYPSPVYNIQMEPIKTELGIDVATYVTDVWWPDMKQFAKEENIEYTAYVTFDYNTYTRPPFTFKEWDKNVFNKNNTVQKRSNWLGTDVYDSGHELGFHGYNHVSLLQTDWKQEEYIVTALKAATKKWKTLDFKELPVSYVPPSNYIDSVGLAMLHKGMPSIKFIQSTYSGEKEVGGGREFDPEPFNKHFFNYPRISSGYFLKPENVWEIESLFLFTGIWTHFVHPDDVYQIPDASNAATSGHFEYRNKFGLNWYSRNGKKGLFKHFKEGIQSFKKRHPMTRFLNATNASRLTMDWRYAYFTHTKYDGIYTVESDDSTPETGEQYWFMYVNEEHILPVDNYLKNEEIEAVKTPFIDGVLYSLKTKKRFISMIDLYAKTNNFGIDISKQLKSIKQEYQKFLVDREVLVPITKRVEEFVEKGQLKKATDLLEFAINDGVNLSENQWKNYAKYMVWQKRGKKVWLVLENYYNENQSKEIANLSRKLSFITEYLSNDIREVWLTRQMEWDTKDEEVFKEYLDFFNTKNRRNKTLMVLRKLLDLNPSLENKKRYLSHLLDYNYDALIPELNKINVCDRDYKKMATTITWAYANHLNYDKALLWKNCSEGLEEETINHWLLNSKSFDDLKETDFPFYVNLLLENDPKKAIRVLQNQKICEDKIKHISGKIAKLYADYNMHKEALKWAKCAKNIPITLIMSWLFETKEYDKLHRVYVAYSRQNPEDYNVKLYMSSLLLYQGKVKHSAEIAASLPNNLDNRLLRSGINKQIKGLPVHQQREILRSYRDLIYPKMRREIIKKIRQNEGNSIEFSVQSFNDKLDPAAMFSTVSYEFFDKKYNAHSLSTSHSILYPINFIEKNEENAERKLWGIGYKFQSPLHKKSRYWGKFRIEKDNFSTLYFQLGAGVQLLKKNKFTSFQLDYFPVRTGPGHILGIYRTSFTNYNEFTLTKRAKQIFSLEANHYSDTEIEGLILGRTEYTVVKKKEYSLSPILEASFGRGSIDRRNGYPYWMAKRRMFGGGGVAITIGQENSAFKLRADASLFAESGEPNFERYTGALSYRIKDYTTLNFSFEVYTIDKYNSNIFQFGLRYNLK